MPIYERPAQRGARRARQLERVTATGLLTARRGAGLSLREVGRLLHVSHDRIARAEQALPGALTIDLAARMAAVTGLQLSVSLHPDGDPVRDAAHLALLERFLRRLPTTVRWRTEVPIPIAGDRRSVDGVIDGHTWQAMVEAETRIDDIQAVERRVSAKQRDTGIDRAILLLSDTRHNRRVLADVPALGSRFPLSTRACLAALRAGRPPTHDAIVIL